jgi:hypothetical protein
MAIDNADLASLEKRLASVQAQARKLFTHISELAYHGRGEDRQAHTAYLPELHESCGLDVEAMYETLEELKRASLIVVEKPYPFEDVVIAKETSGRNAVEAVARSCQQKKIALRDVLVDLKFDLLR